MGARTATREVNGTTERRCVVCKQWKAMDESNFYHRHARHYGEGFEYVCIPCEKFQKACRYARAAGEKEPVREAFVVTDALPDKPVVIRERGSSPTVPTLAQLLGVDE